MSWTCWWQVRPVRSVGGWCRSWSSGDIAWWPRPGVRASWTSCVRWVRRPSSWTAWTRLLSARSWGGPRPEVVVHQMTALQGCGNLRRFDREFAATNALRTSGTDHLLTAAAAAGARRFVAQSYTGWPNLRARRAGEDGGGPARPRARRQRSARPFRRSAISSAPCSTRRWSRWFSGTGPSMGLVPAMTSWPWCASESCRSPAPADGVWSFIHIDDAAAATVLAVEGSATGIFNIVDDDPAPVSQWLPFLAEAIGAKPPHSVPVWLARLAGGEVAVSLLTQIRGASNAKARQELGWQPRWLSWRDGFRDGLDERHAVIERGDGRQEPAEQRMMDEMSGTEVYEELRPLLFSIAYRMLASVAEAEDIVQEAFLRYHRALSEGRQVESPRAFLSTVTTRLSIDHGRSARVRRETLCRRVAAGTPADRHECSRTPPGRPRTPTRCRWPSCSCWNDCHLSSAPCSCCATSLPTVSTRSPRSSPRASPTVARSPCEHDDTSRTASHGSKRRGSNGRSWPPGSSPRWARETWTTS